MNRFDSTDSVVEGAARRLDRAVVALDIQRRLLAHAAPHDRVSPSVAAVIVTRRAPSGFGDPAKGGADPGDSAGPRVATFGRDRRDEVVVCPVTYRGSKLGHLIVDASADSAFSPEDLDFVAYCAAKLALAMREKQALDRIQADDEERLVRRLCGDNRRVREAAARLLREQDVLLGQQRVVALVVAHRADEVHPLRSIAMAGALHGGAYPSLAAEYADHTVLVAPSSEAGDAERLVGCTAQRVYEYVVDRLGCDHDVFVGYGATQASLEDAWVSVGQARRAVAIATKVALGPVVGWQSLGMFSMISVVPPELVPSLLPGRLVAFLEGPDAELLETVERYLDFGGDVRSTARAVSVHPATVRYRLGKVERELGVNVRDGEDRFVLHFALKWRRLVGEAAASSGEVRRLDQATG